MFESPLICAVKDSAKMKGEKISGLFVGWVGPRDSRVGFGCPSEVDSFLLFSRI